MQRMSALAHPVRRTSAGRVARAVVVVLAAAGLISGAWLLGAARAPSSTDASRARAAAESDARAHAQQDAAAAAYGESWSASFAQGAASGRTEGAAAGTKSAASRD